MFDGSTRFRHIPPRGCRILPLELPITGVMLDASHAGQASRALSTARLHMSPCFHLPPINVLVSHGPSEGFTPWECSS